VFRSARIKLTLAYTLVIALVMGAFSVALYLSIATAMANTLDVPDPTTVQTEHAFLSAELARARLALLGINIAGWLVAATASYLVAGRTLAPLESALARQRQFTAHASHELRTPLTVMKGEIDVTMARERSPEQYRETLTRLDDEVIHLEQMTGTLLTLAQAQEARRASECSVGDVGELVHDIVCSFSQRAEDAGILLDTSLPPQLRANLDWPHVRHLLTNLLDNALRHTKRGGTVRVSAAPHGRILELTVFNTGAQIATQDLPHLFVPFYRGKGSSSGGGAGLGLALADWIARSHGGAIAVHNQLDGVSFTVRLPLGSGITG